MRTAFIETLSEIAKRDKNITLLNGDLGFSVLEDFTKQFPERSWNMGVAEANMVGVAAGLAMTGRTVFIYSIIPFVTARVFEQVRNDLALQNMNVKIVGVGEGLLYGQLGPTHHAIEDLAIMRSLPNMTVVAPGDPFEARAATIALAKMKGPAYLRLGKKGDAVVHEKIPTFALGKSIQINKGNDATIFSTGNTLPTARDVAKMLSESGIRARVISMHTLKPLDVRAVQYAARKTKLIATIEEHNVIGGLGSAVAEVLADRGMSPRLLRFGIQDRFTTVSGSHEYLASLHGMDTATVAKKIIRELE